MAEDFLYGQQVLLTGLTLFLVRHWRSEPGLFDADIVEALDALARGYQTLDSGIYYEQPPASVPGQRVYDALKEHLETFSQETQKTSGTSLRPGDVLRALVFLRRLAQLETNGRPKSRRYLRFLRSQLPAEALKEDAPGGPGSPLIVPGR